MLYIVKRLSDSYYLSSFEDEKNRIEFVFTPLKSEALKLPQNIAEGYINTIKMIEGDKYEIIPKSKLD